MSIVQSQNPSTTISEDRGKTWFEIADFTPGIHQIVSPKMPHGAAQETNTYGCVAVDGGALVALPKGTDVTVGSGVPSGANWTSAQGSVGYITGLFANGPVYSLESDNRTWGGLDQINTELWVGCWYAVLGQHNQVDTITIAGTPTGGSFLVGVDTMTNGVRDGVMEWTDPIAYNASAATVATAVKTLSIVGASDVTGAGGALPGTAVTLTWSNSLAAQSVFVAVKETPGDELSGGTNSVVYSSVSTGADDFVREVWKKNLYKDNPDNLSVVSDANGGQFFANIRPRPCYFGATRSNSADATVVGPEVVAFAFDGLGRIFPDDTRPQANVTAKVAEDSGATAAEDQAFGAPTFMVLHQGRYVGFPLTLSASGQLSTWVSNEAIWWTEVNDLTTLDDALSDNYFSLVVGWEQPTGYSSAQSLSHNELLLLKGRGGAVLMRGDLTSPTAYRLPYVHSPGWSLNVGSPTPLGFMYPSGYGGLWLYAGGTKSDNISKNMNADFWRPDYSSDGWGPSHTSMDAWQEYVLLPNNWLFDTDFGGYWRIDDTADITIYHWAVDWIGRHAYGAPQTISTSSTHAVTLVRDYDIATPRSYFSWQSQPMPFSLQKAAEIDEVIIAGSGAGTIKVTVTSNFTGETDNYTFPITSESGISTDLPILLRENFHVHGSHLIVRVESTGVGDQEAPKLHSIRMSYRELHDIQRPDASDIQTEYSTAFSSAFS